MHVEATAIRDGRFWFVRASNFPGVFAQTRRLDQAEAALREVLGLLTAENVDDWVVHVQPSLVGGQKVLVEVARWVREASREAERLAMRAMAAVAHQLRDEGVSQRDIGRLLGISFQRVSQLLAEYPDPPSREELRRHLQVVDASLAGVRRALEPEERPVIEAHLPG